MVKKSVVKKPAKPIVKKPTKPTKPTKPIAKKSVADKPVARTPVAAKPVTKKPAVAKPVAKKRAVNAATPPEIAEIAYTDEVEESETKVAEVPAGDAPRIECRLLVGDLSLLIDATSLEHTLGVGNYGYGRGLVDSWPDDVWASLLAYLRLPAEPLDRDVAAQPVKRLVQRLWYEAIQGGVPDERKAAFAERDAKRAAEYAEKFDHVKETVEGKSDRARVNFAKARVNAVETVYTPTAELKDKKLSLSGQQAPILEFFRATKFAPTTTAQAVIGAVAAGLKTTKQTPERVVAFYFADWVKKGRLVKA